ncbi:MAG TPA: LPS assembly lipoprotein LptE [Oligoflexia bacterium]|nr:LPS assembly lipoprotein LptE [Oligoflexia bacterium]HMP48011.1 LPS assembly lipoprotein LptE [Oligoflexia bacterium]
MTKKTVIFSITILIFSFASCGYRLQGSGSVLPPEIKTISIRNSENSTTFSGLGPMFTEKLRGRFERYGVVKIVDSGEPADAEFISRIVSIESQNRDVQGRSNIQVEQSLLLTVFAELRKKNGQILYRNPALVVTESFGTVSSNVVTSSSSFATGNLAPGSLATLTQREVQRGQAAETLEGLLDEAARKIYLEAVASDF